MDSYNKYKLNLYNQFLNTEGVESVHYQSRAFFKEYRQWLKDYKKILKEYSTYLQNLNINLSSYSVAEVGKGLNDSIVMYPDFQVISPYADTLGEDNADLKFINNKLYISKFDRLVEADNIKRFITFNPYFDDDLSNWHLIHNNGFDISIGVCGRVYDRDSGKKIRLISDIADKMNGRFEENYDVIGDNYFYNIHSKKRIKLNKPH